MTELAIISLLLKDLPREKCTLGMFCFFIHEQFGTLRGISTEELAKCYREYFRLPIELDELALRNHCRELGFINLTKKELPTGLSAFHESYRGEGTILVNSSQWSGIYVLSVFHELYEILDRQFSELFKDYRGLHGQALERKANKFAASILITNWDEARWPEYYLSMPQLELQLGGKMLSSVLSRIQHVAGGRFPSLYIHYTRVQSTEGVVGLLASKIRIWPGKEFMPINSRRILRTLLPKYLDSYTRKWLPIRCHEFQGPVVILRDTGFDLFQRHDLTLFCIPMFSDGEMTDIFLIGIKRKDLLHPEALMGAYEPEVIDEIFQQI